MPVYLGLIHKVVLTNYPGYQNMGNASWQIPRLYGIPKLVSVESKGSSYNDAMYQRNRNIKVN